MLDVRFIRENAEKVKKAVQKRNKDLDDVIDRICTLYDKRKELIFDSDTKKAKQNAVSKEIPALKAKGEDVTSVFSEMKALGEEIKALDSKTNEIDEEISRLIYEIPNIPNESVPYGKDSDENEEIRRVLEPTSFDFDPKPHWELGAELGILDPETAAKVTGTRFTFYKGAGAKLERAIVNFYLDTHGQNGYTEIFPPFMVNRASMTGTGQLPKFEEDAFKVTNTDYFLIPTAEVPVTNMYRNSILSGAQLPIKYCAYSACFRAEAGSAGRDTRGLIRQHQFNKVELVKFVEPENSYEELESLTKDAQRVLELLKLPHRVVKLCSGDLGFSSAMTYDIEVWMPSYNRYVEISSCSNFEDFQARRSNIKYKKDIKDKATLLHTLNGSGVAVGRTVAAILENYQNADVSITVPDVLIPYMGGQKTITK